MVLQKTFGGTPPEGGSQGGVPPHPPLIKDRFFEKMAKRRCTKPDIDAFFAIFGHFLGFFGPPPKTPFFGGFGGVGGGTPKSTPPYPKMPPHPHDFLDLEVVDSVELDQTHTDTPSSVFG